MKAHALPNTLVCEGILDEQTQSKVFVDALEQIRKNGSSKSPIDVDFSKVKYANSTGIVIWLKFGKTAGVSFRYVNAPLWLVSQFNMIRDFFENGTYVESFHAPYFCRATQESRSITLRLGKEIPVQKDYTNFKLPDLMIDGKSYEADFAPERYFWFITENFQIFKEKFA